MLCTFPGALTVAASANGQRSKPSCRHCDALALAPELHRHQCGASHLRGGRVAEHPGEGALESRRSCTASHRRCEQHKAYLMPHRALHKRSAGLRTDLFRTPRTRSYELACSGRRAEGAGRAGAPASHTILARAPVRTPLSPLQRCRRMRHAQARVTCARLIHNQTSDTRAHAGCCRSARATCACSKSFTPTRTRRSWASGPSKRASPCLPCSTAASPPWCACCCGVRSCCQANLLHLGQRSSLTERREVQDHPARRESHGLCLTHVTKHDTCHANLQLWHAGQAAAAALDADAVVGPARN